jgi:protein-tyrosine-phosphatase
MVAELLLRLRRTPDRALHPLRRRRVLEALRRRAPVLHTPAVVLVVCYGNICRSPFAAAVLSRALGGMRGAARVESAGLIAPPPPRRPAPPHAVTAAARHGVDLASHRSRVITADLVHSADLIVVMDTTQRREICDRFGRLPRDVIVLGDLDPEPIDTRRIDDPVDQGLDVFEASYARIERCVGELARALA